MGKQILSPNVSQLSLLGGELVSAYSTYLSFY